jgi:hypothetical protein
MMRTLRGEKVDRPAVNFYEINGLDENPADPDPFNVFNHPSWKPLLDLAREKTDRIVMRGLKFTDGPFFPFDPLVEWESREEGGSIFTAGRLKTGARTLTMRTRRDRDVNTVWTLEHWVKDAEDLEAWLGLPWDGYGVESDVSEFLETEKALGETGIAMMSVADPLCFAAELFGMEDYLAVAFGERNLFRRALDRFAEMQNARMEAASRALPGRLWRIVGPEYASPPYLPPALFGEYAARYDKPMVDAIHANGGWARLHSHGRLRDVLPLIASTGADGLDPVEPPPQGDVELSFVREKYGKQMVLFGNIEITDIENLPAAEFEKKVRAALEQGTAGEGRGFVLQPSACPLGREVPARTMNNYETMVRFAEEFSG